MSEEKPNNWTTKKLVAFLEKAADAYRDGSPLIDDDTYDHVYLSELQRRDPEHPFLHQVEAEGEFGAGRVKHPKPMLSTDKSYSLEETRKWANRIRKEANKQGIDSSRIKVKVTAKLDGLAAMLRKDGKLVTRGDGAYGNNISAAFERGVVDLGSGAAGVGELVMQQDYFDKHLEALGYSHPRSVCVGVVNADEINQDFIPALKAGVVRFVPYSTLHQWKGSMDQLLDEHEEVQEEIRRSTDYPIDGVVAEITNKKLKKSLGYTSHHYRWQIAIKQKAEAKETIVNSVIWQTGRTGRVTPVLEVKPIELSGAVVSRITAHHAGEVKSRRLGKGAVIKAIRAGEVIPKLVEVIKPAKRTSIPKKCHSCGHVLVWEGDFIECANHMNCPAQIRNTLEYFFRIHGQVDGFGPKSIEKLVDAGIDSLEKIYGSTEIDFEKAGFGKGQAKNLRRELDRSQKVLIEDWRFLAAFGIAMLGKGDGRNLLQHLRLRDLEQVAEEEIIAIEGFAELSAKVIVAELVEIWPTISHMLEIGFNLEETPMMSETASIVSPIAGKKIVFTGKMNQGSRDQMQKEATQLGAQVQGSVSAKTDLLVCGESMGASKKSKAEKLDVEMISEDDYIALLKKGVNKPAEPKAAKKSKTKTKVTKKVA
jgi:DNA ligase (NAD+)